MTLHIITQNCSNTLQEVIEIIQADDQISVILLLESATYLMGSIQTSDHFSTYALQDHIIARGINSAIPKTINLIDYEGFVKLVENHNTISW